MSRTTEKPFDESLLSGFLDGVLTQADEQRVRIYLEDSAEARETVEEMRSLRQVTLSTEFTPLLDTQWNERPVSAGSAVSRRLGWLMLSLWLAGVVGFGLWQLATAPGDLLGKLLAFGGVSGVGLLFASVLLDRLRNLKTDRYRGVKR